VVNFIGKADFFMSFMAELHPFVVHFPIALLSLYIVLEVTTYFIKNDALNNFTNWILLFAILTAVNAVLTGNQAEQVAFSVMDKASSVVGESIKHHEQFATYTLWYFLIVLVSRYYLLQKNKMTRLFKMLMIILALCGGILLFQTGLTGGKLVYKYGVGTELFNK
jgi:uncharacterized membrane protein